ncbi:divisome protein SepX/GlpR [Nocardioides sp. WG-D5]
MDPSALIFVALAVAWAVYLVPKALEHTATAEDGTKSRAGAAISKSRRILARREATGKDSTDLVTEKSSKKPEVEKPAPRPVPIAVRRRAARVAAKRRSIVLGVLVLGLAAVGALAGFGVFGPVWISIPAGLVVAWLVTCRLSVRHQREVWARIPFPEDIPEPEPVAPPRVTFDIDQDTGDLVAVVEHDDTGEQLPEGAWKPVETPLPTYVSKEAAPRRTVRTIDLDATGVWSSGRNAADSELVRQAEEAERAAASAAEEARGRATGS